MKKPITKEHRIAFIIALALLIWLVSSPFLFPETTSYILSPIDRVLERIPFSRRIGFSWIFIVPIIWFLAWYFVIRFYLIASRRFQIVVAALIVFGLMLALVFHEQRTYIDWTSHGLNPNRPGFKPQVVILSGTLNGNSYFEIRMRGADYYYSREWNNLQWKVGSWFGMHLVIPGYAWHYGLGYRTFEVGGGGGSGYGASGDIIPARRLWKGTNFIGANTDELIANEPQWHNTEEFQNLEKVGPYLIPRRIIYSGGIAGQEIYTIKKVEFWNEPSTNWFWDLKKKYIDHDSEMMGKNLNEPGPVLGSK